METIHMSADTTTIGVEEMIAAESSVAVPKPKSRARRFVRGLFRVIIGVFVLYCAARLLWRYSGSNQWELVAQRGGAKVYSLKQPGSDLALVRGNVRVKSSLAGLVAWLRDPAVCKDSGCYANTVERIDDQLEYDYFRFNMRSPFKPRDFMVRAHFHQIPSTKEIWAEYGAVPDRVPANDCCHRVTNMNTTWRFTPVGNGMVDAEYTMNMDWGGYIPDLLSNYAKPRFLLGQLRKFQGVLDKPKYQTAKFDFIQEYSGTPTVAANTAVPAAAPNAQ
jgi:hypothetical protein